MPSVGSDRKVEAPTRSLEEAPAATPKPPKAPKPEVTGARSLNAPVPAPATNQDTGISNRREVEEERAATS